MASDNGDYYNNPKLPEDLLIEIFLRSSVESLLRVKCVCKHLYGLIKDPRFVYKHLHHQKNRKTDRLLLQYSNAETQGYKYTILDDKTQSSTTPDNIKYLQVTHHSLDIEGPVNGLYCVVNSFGRTVLWNPTLKEFKIVPLPPPHSLPNYKVGYANAGFGFDPLTNDYKVVLVREFTYPSDENHYATSDMVATLYNLTTNTWRTLDLGDFPDAQDHLHLSYSNSFLNETCYWWGTWCDVVIAFDMGNEIFRVIPGPDISQLGIPRHFFVNTLEVYEERVVLLCNDYRSDDISVNIWLMLEEGIWIKQFSVGPLVGLRDALGFWKNQGLLLVFNDSEPLNPNSLMVYYDVNTQEMRNIGPRATDMRFRTCVYCESLVSLGGGNERDDYMVSDFLDTYAD